MLTQAQCDRLEHLELHFPDATFRLLALVRGATWWGWERLGCAGQFIVAPDGAITHLPPMSGG